MGPRSQLACSSHPRALGWASSMTWGMMAGPPARAPQVRGQGDRWWREFRGSAPLCPLPPTGAKLHCQSGRIRKGKEAAWGRGLQDVAPAWVRQVTGRGAASLAAAHTPLPARAPGPVRSSPAGPPAGASLGPSWAPAPAALAPGHTPVQVSGHQGSATLCAPTGQVQPAACVLVGPLACPPTLELRSRSVRGPGGAWLTLSSRCSPRASRAEDSMSAVAWVPTTPASSRQAAVYKARSASAPSSQELWGS